MRDIQPETQDTPLWRWINPDNFRYYQAGLVSDLFGDWTLISVWGGLGTRRGNYGLTGVLSYADGLQKIGELAACRQKRGYVPVSIFGDWMVQIAQMRGPTIRPLPRKAQRMPNAMAAELLLALE